MSADNILGWGIALVVFLLGQIVIFHKPAVDIIADMPAA